MGEGRQAARDILTLSRVAGVGPARLRLLLEHFRDAGAVIRAPVTHLARISGIDQRTAHNIAAFFRHGVPADAAEFADDQLARLDATGAVFLTILDPAYPPHLRRIYDPPPFLFMLGALESRDSAGVAVVGTREPTFYGTRVTEALSAALAVRGITVVSGLARGIDTTAHATALRSGGRTIAVIGSGLDVLYPPENAGLARRIIASGAILSEFPMGTKPDAVNFPQRNRIVSGMSLGTLVTETGTAGGAMITARTALDQNREVFAIPAPVDGTSRAGTNALLREGRALLVETAEDIIAELAPALQGLLPAITAPPPPAPPPVSLFEQQVLDVLSREPLHIDAIAERTALTAADALVRLLGLECKGVVRQLPGKHFIRI